MSKSVTFHTALTDHRQSCHDRSLQSYMKDQQLSVHRSMDLDVKEVERRSGMEEHREQVLQKKKRLDITHRKVKTFFVLRPYLVQQFKHEMLEQSFKRRWLRKLTMSYAGIILLKRAALSLRRRFQARREQEHLKLKKIWMALAIKSHFKRHMRRLGNSYSARTVRCTRQCLTL